MILRFVAENFRSFKSEVSLDFVSSSHVPLDPEHKYRIGRLNIVKNLGIWGANASGKSTIIQAAAIMKDIVLGNRVSGNIAFKGQESIPTRFDVLFETNERFFEYEVCFKMIEGLDLPEIVSESLYEIFKSKDPELIYDSNKGIQKVDDDNLLAYERGFKEVMGLTFLSYIVAPERRIRDSKTSSTFQLVYEFFARKIQVYVGRNEMLFAIREESVELIKDKLHNYDTGIEQVDFVETIEEEKRKLISSPFVKEQIVTSLYKMGDSVLSSYFYDGSNVFVFKLEQGALVIKKLVFKHAGIEKYFAFEEESEGTKIIFLLLAMLMGKDNCDCSIFVDEIEKSSHPSVVNRVIKDFQALNRDNKTQLVFTSHLDSLMDSVLKKDEVYFVEKNDYGESRIKSLLEFKSTNHREKYAEKYREGRYGAVPNIVVRVRSDAAV